MADGKKGFILYADYYETIKKLPLTKQGKLIKLIFEYVNDFNPVCDDKLVDLVWTPIKMQLKRDLKHWEEVREKRSNAGKLGGRPKKQNKANKANAFFEKQTKAKKAVIVNVNDNVIVNDNVKDIINGFDFDFKVELLNYIIYLQKTFKREIGHMQIEQMIRMLDGWYNSTDKKILCLSANISNGWKTLNFVKLEDLKQINYDIK